MLTQQQIDHYRTFGFVVLRRHLDPTTIGALSREVDEAFRDAFGEIFDERPDENGITGHYLPVMSTRTPVSRGLVEDDRIFGVAGELLGGLPLPTYAEAILYFDQAGMHDDYGIPITGVKFACYLEPLRGENGALRFLPGSQHGGMGSAIRDYLLRHPADDARTLREQIEALPCHVAETDPGDVIAFDAHVFHASIYGRDRRQWTVTYHRDPSSAQEHAAYREWLEGEVTWATTEPPYARENYPWYPREWMTDPAGNAARASFVPRMAELGTFEAFDQMP